MYVLIITVIIQGITSVQAIQLYSSLQECQHEQVRITLEMKKVYPINEHDQFNLTCIPAKSGTPL